MNSTVGKSQSFSSMNSSFIRFANQAFGKMSSVFKFHRFTNGKVFSCDVGSDTNLSSYSLRSNVRRSSVTWAAEKNLHLLFISRIQIIFFFVSSTNPLVILKYMTINLYKGFENMCGDALPAFILVLKHIWLGI